MLSMANNAIFRNRIVKDRRELERTTFRPTENIELGYSLTALLVLFSSFCPCLRIVFGLCHICTNAYETLTCHVSLRKKNYESFWVFLVTVLS